ncbi:hypothetical protein [Microbacterium sp. NPDC087665]|uniref:hypothetical protein n=1 Tax=Microbacterium sp. NPDC087665 TaxID=3364194 RepID=UPI00380BF4D5
MTDELSISDRIYYAIASLRGWGPVLAIHQDYGAAQAWRVGSLISSILIAADDDRLPLAIFGTADDSGTGEIVAVYPDFLVLASVTNLDVHSGDFTVDVHPLAGATNLRVSTRHNYYAGVTETPRHTGLEVAFDVDGKHLTFASTQTASYSDGTLTDDKAVADAFTAIRDAVSRNARA